MKRQAESDIFNSRGKTLVFIAQNPACTINQMSLGLFLTKRSIWGIVGELRKAELIRVEKRGRTHYYTVNDHEFAYHLERLSSGNGNGS